MEEEGLRSGERSSILPKYYNFKSGGCEDSVLEPKTSPLNLSLNGTSGTSCSCRAISVAVVLLLIAALIALGSGIGTYYGLKRFGSKEALVDAIKTSDLKELLLNLQDTAVNNSRSVLNGYNNSAEFVFEVLKECGYEPRKQFFVIPVPEVNKGTFSAKVTINDQEVKFDYPQNNQFQIMLYSAGCTVVNGSECTWNLVSLIDDEESDFGCGIVDDSVEGKAVLVPYENAMGNCSVYDKAINAKEAGATAVIFATTATNTDPPISAVTEKNNDGTVSYVDIPSIGVTKATGHQLADLLTLDANMEVTLELSAKVANATTYNVIAETKEGRADRVVMIGSHLDSVPAGPGINDDGSGSMTNLLIAIQIAKLDLKPKNKIRFAWWGAEELGLYGSLFYVSQLSNEERINISLYLNFDMLGSPNFKRGVFRGSSTLYEDVMGPSTKIQELFIEYFDNVGKTYELVDFGGNSDYRPFLEVGIPVGGLFTGAGEAKTEKQWELFGGIINAALDPCYHQACDTVNNIDHGVYLDMTRAAAYTLQALAEQNDLELYLQS